MERSIKILTSNPETRNKPLGWNMSPLLQDALLTPEKFGKYRFAPARTREFLIDAIESNAPTVKPDKTDEDLWIRRRNVTAIYFSTPVTLDQLAKIYGISRELVRVDIETEMENLKENFPDELKEKFPHNSIPLSKRVGDYPPEYTYLVRGGAGNKVLEALDQGKMGNEIIRLIPQGKHGSTVKILEELGVNIEGRSHINGEIDSIIEGLKDKERTDLDVQLLLNQVNPRVAQLNSQASDEEKFITSVINTAKDVGFHLRLRDYHLIYESLVKSGVPVGHFTTEVKKGPRKGTLPYYFIAMHHRDRAIEALIKDASLERLLINPVIKISGSEAKIPTTFDIMKRGTYRRSGPIFQEVGLADPVNNWTINRAYNQYLNSDCPVSIFKHKGSYFYSIDQEEELREYLRGLVSKGK